MDKILSINTIKNVFAALGAKTSDDNYGVALLDKTSGEPKGLMGIGDLASVLGVVNLKFNRNGSISDAPTNYGFLISFKDDNIQIDLYFSQASSEFDHLYTRLIVNGTVNNWKQLI